MKTVIWFSVLFALIILAAYTDSCLEKQEVKARIKMDNETFAMPLTASDSVEDNVIRIYNGVLERNPNSKELIDETRKITSNVMTYDGLKQRLVDSDEYARFVKMQSNAMAPELNKVISDRSLLTRMSEIYTIELKRDVPGYMVLPLKDIFIRLEYNEQTQRAMYRHLKYNYFEQDVKFIQGVNHQQLMDLFDKYFIVSQLLTAGAAIHPIPSSSDTAPFGADPRDLIYRTPHDKDADSSSFLKNIAKNAAGVFNLNGAGKNVATTSNTVTGDGSGYIDIPTHQGDMVLDPALAWSVPQQRAPVCTTLGQKQLIQPVFVDNSKLLLGTPLDDAAHTTVGSIMPSFEYKEFVRVPK